MVGKINSRFNPEPEMNISQAFNIENNEVISLVGSGGKTTLMFTIARELSSAGNKVITTTTTKIASHEPEQYGSPLMILEQDEERPVQLILDHLNKNRQITVAAGELPQTRKKGSPAPRPNQEAMWKPRSQHGPRSAPRLWHGPLARRL